MAALLDSLLVGLLDSLLVDSMIWKLEKVWETVSKIKKQLIALDTYKKSQNSSQGIKSIPIR